MPNFTFSVQRSALPEHLPCPLTRIQDSTEYDSQPVSPEAKFGKLVKVNASSSRNIFPVVNTEQKLEGFIYLYNVPEMMFKTDKHKV